MHIGVVSKGSKFPLVFTRRFSWTKALDLFESRSKPEIAEHVVHCTNYSGGRLGKRLYIPHLKKSPRMLSFILLTSTGKLSYFLSVLFYRIFTYTRPLRIQVRTQACHDTGNEINFLEHVEVIVSLAHPKRGAVRMFLESPMGRTNSRRRNLLLILASSGPRYQDTDCAETRRWLCTGRFERVVLFIGS